MRGEYLLTVEEARRHVGARSVKTVYRLVDAGELPAVRIGPRGGWIRVQYSDVLAYLERNRVEPGSLCHLLNG